MLWSTRKDHLGKTDITEKDLARAAEPANDLGAAAAKEDSNVDAAHSPLAIVARTPAIVARTLAIVAGIGWAGNAGQGCQVEPRA